MPRNSTRLPIQRGLTSRTHRRGFVAGTLGLGLGTRMVGHAAAQSGPPAVVSEIDPKSATYPLVEEKRTLSILVPSHPLVESYEANDFTRWYEERTNVHIEWDVVPGGEDTAAALNLRLAGGNYPDIIMGFRLSPSILQLYGAQGLFQPLNDLIDTHGVEMRRMLEQQPTVRPSITALDGNIYALPTFAGCFHCSYSQKLWIYQPWLDALGLEMPSTTDEFEQVLLAFKEQDPNGNGESDEIPLMSGVSGANPLDTFFMNAFLYNPGLDSLGTHLVVRDGTVEPVYTAPEWREGIKYLARLFSQGLIDPESFTQNRDQIRDKFLNEPDVIAGSVPALAPSSFLPVPEGEYGRWTDYVAVPPLEGPEGVRFAAYDPYNALRSGEFMITDRCADPALAFRWADGLYDLETTIRSTIGVLGEHWRWAEEGEVGNNGEPAIAAKLEYGGVRDYWWGQHNPYYRPERVHSGYVMNPEIADRSLETILYTETREKYAPYAQPAEWTLPPLTFDEQGAAQVAEFGATILAYVEETFARSVTGQIDIDAEWDGYLATLEGMGLPQYVEIHQQAYNAWRSAG